MATRMYVPDASAWEKHYQSMGDGSVNSGGQFHSLKKDKHKSKEDTPEVKMVSESQDIVNQAKAQLKEEEQEFTQVAKQRGARKPPSKRPKAILLKDRASDIFSH